MQTLRVRLNFINRFADDATNRTASRGMGWDLPEWICSGGVALADFSPWAGYPIKHTCYFSKSRLYGSGIRSL